MTIQYPLALRREQAEVIRMIFDHDLFLLCFSDILYLDMYHNAVPIKDNREIITPNFRPGVQ